MAKHNKVPVSLKTYGPPVSVDNTMRRPSDDNTMTRPKQPTSVSTLIGAKVAIDPKKKAARDAKKAAKKAAKLAAKTQRQDFQLKKIALRQSGKGPPGQVAADIASTLGAIAETGTTFAQAVGLDAGGAGGPEQEYATVVPGMGEPGADDANMMSDPASYAASMDNNTKIALGVGGLLAFGTVGALLAR